LSARQVTGKWKADEEVITSKVPAIIEPHQFEQVQRQLHARSPKVAAPRVTTGPILLTGLAVCATCNGEMMLRTGTSKTGAVHHYYACSTCARKGKTVCKGRSMAKLDIRTLKRATILLRIDWHSGLNGALLW
jgi:site-specific DNA recombinase